MLERMVRRMAGWMVERAAPGGRRCCEAGRAASWGEPGWGRSRASRPRVKWMVWQRQQQAGYVAVRPAGAEGLAEAAARPWRLPPQAVAACRAVKENKFELKFILRVALAIWEEVGGYNWGST
mmetsp:Transcript_76849/g.207385  ORF Transcript_76849/g.207385 Transcript_76849/m.207385 type:complete len:123 (-) Transcript_76849:21-389(-)